MDTWRRRTALYLVGIVAVMLTYAAGYNAGMAALEGRPQTFLHSLQVVVETFTTVGFGSDAPWSHPLMTAFVIVMELTGVALIFLALPAFVVPLFEEIFAATAPLSIEAEDHVVVCGFTPRDRHLVEELEARDIEYAILVADEERASDLHAEGHTVVHGDPETTAALEGACVDAARAVVLDAGDESNAAVALSVREVAPSVTVISYVEDPSNREYLQYAGADTVVSPRHVLGQSLAGKVASAVTANLETVEIGADFEIVEVPIQTGSDLDGVTLDDPAFSEFTGVSVIGAWIGGEFEPSPDPDRRIDRSSILLLAGEPDQLSALADLARTHQRPTRPESVVLVGHGEVGSTVREDVEDEGIDVTVVDAVDGPNVDVVGDATEAATLERAGVADAEALILALGDDTATIFTALVAREVAPGVQLISRVDTAENVPKLYAAGADYVLALETVSGRMLAAEILGEDVMSLETNVEVVRTAAPALAGETLAGADVRSETGVTVIAVERSGRVVTDLPPDFRVEPGDALIVAGTDEAVRAFTDFAGARDERS